MNFFRRIYSFDYMGHKYWWFTISGIIIAAGLISLFVKGGGNPIDGLNYGLEFKEGTRIAVAFEQSSVARRGAAGGRRGGLRGRADPADGQRRRQRCGRASRSRRRCSRPPSRAPCKQALDDKFTIAETDGNAGLGSRR